MINLLLLVDELSPRQTFLAWFLFALMLLIIVGFGVIVGYKAFKKKTDKKDDV